MATREKHWLNEYQSENKPKNKVLQLKKISGISRSSLNSTNNFQCCQISFVKSPSKIEEIVDLFYTSDFALLEKYALGSSCKMHQLSD